MPRLTLYLLKLATDTQALDDYRAHRDGKKTMDLRAHLTAAEPGLTAEQADAIASLDSARIQKAVDDELRSERSFEDPDKAFLVQFNFEVNHIQHPPPPHAV